MSNRIPGLFKRGAPDLLPRANIWTRDNTFKSGRPWFDVRAFGAIGDGVTDDKAAIQAAIDAAAALGGGIVYFPPGVYKITAALTISSIAISLCGPGRLSAQIKASFTTGNIISISASYVEVDNLAVTGPGNAVVTSGTAIRVLNGQGCKLTNLFISDVFNGIDLDNSTNCFVQFCKVLNLYGNFAIRSVNGGGDYIVCNQFDPVFYGFGSYAFTDGFAAWIGSHAYIAGNVVSSNGYFWSCSQSGTSAAAGGLTPTTFGTQVTDGTAKWHMLTNTNCSLVSVSLANSNFIAFNDCSGPSSVAIKLDNADGNIVKGNTIGQIIGDGIQLGASATHTDIEGNILSGLYGQFSSGIVDTGLAAAGTRISNNRINGAGWYGIFCQTPTAHWNVNNNTVQGTGQTTSSYGIEVVANAQKFRICDNVVIPGVMAGAIRVNTGTSDYYLVTDNLVEGGTVTDGGTGANKVVSNNK